VGIETRLREPVRSGGRFQKGYGFEKSGSRANRHKAVGALGRNGAHYEQQRTIFEETRDKETHFNSLPTCFGEDWQASRKKKGQRLRRAGTGRVSGTRTRKASTGLKEAPSVLQVH